MGRVSDRFGRPLLILIGLCVCGGMIILIPQFSGFLELIVLAAAFGLGEAIVTSSSAALIADLAQVKMLGAGMGLRGTIMDAGHASGHLLAGILIGQIGYAGGFGVIGVVQFFAAVLFGVIMIKFKKPAVL